jgi:microcystin-dependent protein
LPLETATYVTDLVTSNPAHTDGLSQADSHMRLLKSTLKATFPNFTSGSLASTQAALDAAATAAAGTSASRIPLGTAALPGLTPIGDPNTGILSPAADQLAVSLGGTQVLLMGGSALVTSLGVAAAAVASTGAYSGGTGQLVPIGAVLEWYEDVLPAEGGYCWANGQIIASASTVCPILLARWGSRFGGNGTTTMGVPDRRNTVGVGKSTMGAVADRGLLANITSSLLTTLGSLFGSGAVTLTAAKLPANIPNTLGATFTPTSGSSTVYVGTNPPAVTNLQGGSVASVPTIYTAVTLGGSVAVTGNINPGGGGATDLEQPSTTCNYILRLA